MAKRYEVSVYSKIQLGRSGENLAREIAFDISEWVKDYGDGDVHLFHRRNTDTEKYPVPITIVDDKAIWTVTEPDVAIPGTGECELEYTAGDTVAKTRVYETEVLPSMGGSVGKAPTPSGGWYAEVQKAVKIVLKKDRLFGIYFGLGEMPEGYQQQVVPSEKEEIVEVETLSQAERDRIVQEIIETVVGDVHGVVDAEKNVTLSSEMLPPGTYTFRLKVADGSLIELGQAVVEA